jgi:hypothetical protein
MGLLEVRRKELFMDRDIPVVAVTRDTTALPYQRMHLGDFKEW